MLGTNQRVFKILLLICICYLNYASEEQGTFEDLPAKCKDWFSCSFKIRRVKCTSKTRENRKKISKKWIKEDSPRQQWVWIP